ncbi:hypothetical protein BRC69_00545 [Halobacteriales archaeon QH_6_66_25]|nr:MAG: hypothetical protein BRC69_00545 [Halobacteriales archaeon QH_6_66_25]
MPSIPPSTFASGLGELSHRAFVRFVADLWAASGWETTAEPPVVRAHRNGTDRRLLVLPPTRFARLRAAPAVDRPVDAVVTPRSSAGALPRGTPEARVVTAEDLHERLRHGVPAETGERLCQAALGVPLRDDRWADDGSLLGIADGDAGGPITRRAALGALGVGAVGASAVLLRRQLTDDSADRADDGDLEGFDDADDVAPTPDNSGADDVGEDSANGGDGTGGDAAPDKPGTSFAITYEDGRVVITHDGGDPIPAGELSVRGDGLRVGPVYQWSRERRYGVDDPITEGDSLSLSADGDYAITVVWDGPESQVVLARDTGPATDGPDRPVQPDALIAFELDGDTLVVRHAGGDGILAKHLRLRGGGFEGAPVRQWSAAADIDSDAPVEAGDSVTLAVAPDRVAVNVIWDASDTAEFAERPTRLGGYRGPARPLGVAGSVPSSRIDPQNTGFVPGVSGPSPPLSARWTFTTRQYPTVPPLLVNGVVYVASAAPYVHALDATDGAELWRFEPEGSVGGGMAVADGTVYAPTSGGVLHALDAADGSEHWRQSFTWPPGSAPTVVTGSDGAVEGLFLETPPTEMTGAPEILHAIGPDGTDRWQVQQGETRPADSGPQRSGPPVVDDVVVFGSTSGTLAAYDRADGSERWRRDPDSRFHGAPAVRDGTVYATTLGGTVSAVDATEGCVGWQVDLGTPVVAPAVTADRILVTASDGTVTVLDRADGTEQWRRAVDAPVTQPPVVAGDSLYLVGGDGTLSVLDVADGTVRWSADDRDVAHPPAVTDGALYTAVNRSEQGHAMRALEPG